MSRCWFKGCLEFTCPQCGRCCTGAPGYVWVTRKEVAELAKLLDTTVERFAKRYLRKVGRRYSLKEKANYDCVFYEDGCTVYSARPHQCRTYPFWPENLKTRQAWDEVNVDCPGVGNGRLYPAELVQRIVRGEEDASS